MTKRYYKNFDEGKLKCDSDKVDWPKHCDKSDSKFSVKHFLK